MSHPVIEADECIGCGICVDACPQEVLEVVGGVAEVVNEDACIACGDCVEECPMGAIPEVIETNLPLDSLSTSATRTPVSFMRRGFFAFGKQVRGSGVTVRRERSAIGIR